MFANRTHGVVAATLGVLLAGACTDPVQDTDLRPEGPPDVLAVLVMTDASAQLSEKATYCKLNDPKRPGVVGLPDATTSQICPDDGTAADEVTDAYPDGWYVRVMFDELLDPSIETLTELTDDTGAGTGTFSGSIASTHPVTLQCQSVNGGGLVNVDYDGYYQPAGNNVTWPLGPSLVIKPNDPKLIATGKECQVTLGDIIKDKDSNPVPMDERGPFKFKVAPIKVISIDPSDDPDSTGPIPAVQIFYDNPYIQFNTAIDESALVLEDEQLFSIKDVAHPDEGPGYCNKSKAPCGSLADCTTTGANPDTVCGRGFCGATSDNCNTASDCPTANDHCTGLYEYSYVPYGGTETEFGIGPYEPIETEHKYTMQFTQGAKLKDRCGAETTLGAPSVADLTLVHFSTDKFDFVKASIADGETASAMKRLQYNWNNVVEGSDFNSGYTYGIAPSPALSAGGSSPAFTLSPMPKVLTGPCTTSGCPTSDIAAADLLIVSADASGQVQAQGHYQMNTEYTATIKAGTVVKDFYGKMWTNTSNQVIKWKTAPAIVVTGIGVRQPGTVVTVTDKGTVKKPTPTSKLSVRIGFNASMDPTTLDASEVSVAAVGTGPAAPTLAVSTPSGCGYWEPTGPNDLFLGDNSTGYIGSCSLTLSGLFEPGSYTITLKKGAAFKDIFGTAYTQAADQSITITVVDAPAPAQCL